MADEPLPASLDDVSGALHTTAANLRADHRDVEALLRALSVALDGVVGVHLQVEHGRGRLGRFLGDIPFVHSRSGRIRSLDLRVGDRSFRVDAVPALHCHVGTVSATAQLVDDQQVNLSGWAQLLLEALDHQATVTSTARRTLEELMVR